MKAFWTATVIVVVSCLTFSHVATAQSNFIWADESYIVWIWYQAFPSFLFLKGITGSAAAPPLDFIFGSIVWRTLHFAMPHWSMANLEIALRLYPMMVMGIATALLVLCLKRILRSWTLALVFAVVATRSSPAINYYFCEVRFYAALYLFTVALWWGYLRAQEALLSKDSLQIKKRLGLYLAIGTTGLWVHIYTSVTFAATGLAILFLLVSTEQINILLKKYFRYYGIATVLNILVWFTWLRHCPLAGQKAIWTFLEILRAWSITMNELALHFVPLSVFFLLASLYVCLSKPRGRNGPTALIYPLVLASTLLVATVQLRNGYFWEPRYLFYLMPSFILGAALILSETGLRIKQQWDHPSVALGICFLAMAIVPEHNWKPSYPEGDPFVRVRKALWVSQAQVSALAGLDETGERNVRRVSLGFIPKIYGSGIDDMRILSIEGEGRFLSRMSRRFDPYLAKIDYFPPRRPGHPVDNLPLVSCLDVARYPVIQGLPSRGESVVIDFCPVQETQAAQFHMSTTKIVVGPLIRRFRT